MPGYTGFHTKKNGNWSATAVAVGVIGHVLLVGVLYWVSQTPYIQSLIKVSKLTTVQEPATLPDPPTSREKTLEPEMPLELLPQPPPVAKPPQPEPVQEETAQDEPPGPPADAERLDSKPANTTSFAIGKGRGRFSGYEDLLTASIQAVYKQPADLPDGLDYAVLCQLLLDEDGYVLGYKLVNSSGSEAFDRSTQQALSRLRQVRPPPAGMSRTIVVKFFPP